MSNVKIFSPNNIEVLLHCYVSPEPHPRLNSPAVIAALNFLYDLGAIKLECKDSGNRPIYRTTDLGNAWVRALERVPCPKSVYVDEQGEPL